MTAPFAKPFAAVPREARPHHEPSVESVEEPEGESVVGKRPEPEPGGDPSYYGKETTVSHYPHGIKDDFENLIRLLHRLSEQDQKSTAPKTTREVNGGKPPKDEGPEGKSVVGDKVKMEPEGDPEFYKPEKKLRDLGKIESAGKPSKPGIVEA